MRGVQYRTLLDRRSKWANERTPPPIFNLRSSGAKIRRSKMGGSSFFGVEYQRWEVLPSSGTKIEDARPREASSVKAFLGAGRGLRPISLRTKIIPTKLLTLLDLRVSSLRKGHVNLLCLVPILTDDPRRESTMIIPTKIRRLNISGKSPVDMRIPPLKLEIMLASNLLKSRILGTEIDRTANPLACLRWGAGAQVLLGSPLTRRSHPRRLNQLSQTHEVGSSYKLRGGEGTVD